MASVTSRSWTHNGVTKKKWTVRYKDRDGTHRSKACSSKKEADNFCRQVENELESGTHIARATTRTIAELIAEFVEHSEQRCADGRIGEGRVFTIKQQLRFAKDWLGSDVVSDLKWQRVEAFYRHLLKVISKNSGRLIDPSYAKMIIDTLGSMLQWGVRRGYLVDNPVPHAKREIGAKSFAKIETFTSFEMRRLLAAVEDSPTGNMRGQEARTKSMARAIIYLAAFCGLRKGEILALTWDSFAFDHRVVMVRHSLTPQPYDVIKGPKTDAGFRDVPLPSAVIAALEDWRRHVRPEPRGLIFRAKGGSPLGISFYRNLWQPVLSRAGLDPKTGDTWRHFHALRHFAGSAWLDAGATLPEVSRLLGHGDVAITAKIYAHAINDIAKDAPLLERAMTTMLPPTLLIAQEVRNAA